jgi:SAM-dependent methyltransferase
MTMRVHQRYTTYIEDQRQFFDELIAEEWESYISEAWDRVRSYEIERLFAFIQPRRILDIGCGCGFHDRVMAGYPFVERIDAFDYSAQSIAKAQEAYPHPKAFRTVADFDSFAVEAPYDLAVSFQVFEHLSDPKPYFDLCRRATRRGGHIAILMPNRLRLANVLRMLRFKEPQLADPQHFREYTARETIALGRKAGFAPVAAFGYGLAATGIGFFDRAAIEQQLRWSRFVPAVANGIGVVMRRP